MRQKHVGTIAVLVLLVTALVALTCSACTTSGVTSAGGDSASGTQVPDFPGYIILSRPEDRSIAANVTVLKPASVYLEWGKVGGAYSGKTSAVTCSSGTPTLIVASDLTPDTAYRYRVMFRVDGEGTDYKSTEEYTFHTARAAGSSYWFVVQSDSHLLNKADPTVYEQSMRSMAALKPDFMFDMGDTFLNDQKADPSNMSYETVESTVKQQLPYFDLVARNAPLFLTIGNHEGEYGAWLDGTKDNLAAMEIMARTKFYANPIPDSFYSGKTATEPLLGLTQDYFAFTWGDALYVSISPYLYSTNVDPYTGEGGGWDWTLGKTQYDWFRSTLEQSNAKYKFVFAHHAIGNIRGGEQVARLYEWGGYDKNSAYRFDEMRPGWGKPIQQVMKDTGVTIFFQGHDHLFAREMVDGVVYQTLPKPAEVTPDNQSNYDAYPNGDVLLNSGFLSVTVTPQNVRVDYYRNYFVSSNPQEGNTGVVYSYTVDPGHNVQVLKSTKDDLSKYSEAPATTKKGGGGKSGSTSGTLIDLQPAPDGGFSFAVQADSHLDKNTDTTLYRQTLANIAAGKPAFLFDLGDTSMAEKYSGSQAEVDARFAESASYFDLISSVPLYPVTGNHDGECGWDSPSLRSWALSDRLKYFPMPQSLPYTGNTTTANYYAFTYGDAQFIVLDPFTYSTKKQKDVADGWNYTLGKTQYDWLKNCLAASTAKHKFVLIHNLVGGLGKDARGGVEAAKLFEWGGYNPDGTYGFDTMRAGWGKPIHDMLVSAGVTAVFHGHDHFYARQEKDGIIYELVPQPGGTGNTVSSAPEYGYVTGTMLPPAGYVRAAVSGTGVRLEYVTSSVTMPGVNCRALDVVDIK